MQISKENSEHIRAISFLCALMVVAIHCTSVTKEWWSGQQAVPQWIALLQIIGSDTVVRFAVPWFFIVSGFFLVKNLDVTACVENGAKVFAVFKWWKGIVGKRLLTLGIPYLLWNVIYYLFKFATGKYGFEWRHCLDQLVGYDLYGVPACGQFWYVRALIVYIVFSPLFVMMLWHRVVGAVFLLSLLTCWFLGIGLPIRYMQITDFSYMAYFGTGVYLSLSGTDLRKRFSRPAFAVCAAIFVASLFGVVYGGGIRDAYLSSMSTKAMIVAGIPVLWGLGSVIAAATSGLRRFYGLAFFVYAIHVMLCSITYKVTVQLMPPELYHSVGYLLKIAVGVVGSVTIGALLGRFAPRALQILCGGRG